jgi:hypothetical protein
MRKSYEKQYFRGSERKATYSYSSTHPSDQSSMNRDVACRCKYVLSGENITLNLWSQKAVGCNQYDNVPHTIRQFILDLHRLVYLSTCNWLRKQEQIAQWTEKAITRLEEVFPDDRDENRNLWRIYLSHIRCELVSNDVDKDRPERMELMQRFETRLFSDGRYDEAEVQGVEVLEFRKRVLGQEHPQTLRSMSNLARTLWKQERWKEAEYLEILLLETRKRVLGQEHPDTLTSMSNLILPFKNQSRWKEAENLERLVLEKRKRVLGPEHPDALIVMNNLAFTWKEQGKDKKALKLMEQRLRLRTKTIGTNHPDTLSAREALLTWQTEDSEVSASVDRE